jgi:hypothetical protein
VSSLPDPVHESLVRDLEVGAAAWSEPCPDCARLKRELAELDRKAERYRREAEQAGGLLWGLECEIQELRRDLEEARA